MGRVSRGLILLNVLTFAAPFAAAWVVYAFASGLALLPAWLPVLLVGLGTALVASAIGPGYIPGRGPGTKGHTLAWLGVASTARSCAPRPASSPGASTWAFGSSSAVRR